MGVLALVALIAVAVWAAGVYAFPFRDCRRCGATGRKTSRINRRHHDLCRYCAGTGHVQRFGSRHVHRAVLAARSQAALARQRRRDQRAADRATVPGTDYRPLGATPRPSANRSKGTSA
jgi:hypothetical protein